MSTPKLGPTIEDCPVPVGSIIGVIYVEFSSEELEEEIGIVENRQVHDVHSKQTWYREWLTRKAAEECLFAESQD